MRGQTKMKKPSRCRSAPGFLCCVAALALAPGCDLLEPYGGVGVFDSNERTVRNGDAIYGKSPDGKSCAWVQYRLSGDDVMQGRDSHIEFFATNFTTSSSLVASLETNLLCFASHEGSIVVVKGVLYDPEEKIKRDAGGKWIPETLFAAVYDETPPSKAIVFMIPGDEKRRESLASYALPLENLDVTRRIAFPCIRDRNTIRESFAPESWKWSSPGEGKVNRTDINDPTTGKPIMSFLGTDVKVLTPDEAEKVDRSKYAILEIRMGKDVSPYSKDGRIKYSSGLKGAFERNNYEQAPDAGPYWMYLDSEYVRVHKPGCERFEKGRGRHCTWNENGMFDTCCGGKSLSNLRYEAEAREREAKMAALVEDLLRGIPEIVRKHAEAFTGERTPESRRMWAALQSNMRRMPVANRDCVFDLLEERPDAIEMFISAYKWGKPSPERHAKNLAFALRIAEERHKSGTRLLALLMRDTNTSEDFRKAAIANPKLEYCREQLTNALHSWRY